jgi:hypothetical protein
VQHASQTGHERGPDGRARNRPLATPAVAARGMVLSRAANVAALQRTVGNQAVVGMIPTPAVPTRPAPAIARPALLQRQVTHTPGPANAPGTFSAVNLAAEQGGDGDGHTIDRHVTITDAELQARLVAEPAIPAATRWESQAAAEATVDAALAARRVDVANWLGRGETARTGAATNRALVANQLPNVTTVLWQAAAQAARTQAATTNVAPATIGQALAPITAALGRIRASTTAAPAATLVDQVTGQAGVVVDAATVARDRLAALAGVDAAIPALPTIAAVTTAVGAILAAATNWRAALQTARGEIQLELQHDTALANVSAAFRVPAGVQLTTAPRAMIYLYYVDATHFQVKTAFPGDPVNLAPPPVALPQAPAQVGQVNQPVVANTGGP